MGLGIEITGRWNGGADRCSRIEDWLRNHSAAVLQSLATGTEEGATVLSAILHPAAEPMTFAFADARSLTISARTSSVGPGYHIYACELLHRLAADFGIAWALGPDDCGDDTNYFDTADRAALNEDMLRWLATVCESVLEEYDSDAASVAIAMPADRVFAGNEFLITPMGPRSRAWAEHTARHPKNGRDFFAWWDPSRDAPYFLNRALCLMWTEVRWRKPLMEAETLTLKAVSSCLAEAHRIDPDLGYPLREWRETEEFLGRSLPDAVHPSVALAWSPAALVGYRRNPVRVSLCAGWSIQIPGRFAEEWDDEGTWCGWDPDMSVWFSAFSRTRDGGPVGAAEILGDYPVDGDDLVTREDGVLGKGCFRWSGDEGYWRLSARSAVDGRFCLSTICFTDPALRSQALEIWRSIRA